MSRFCRTVFIFPLGPSLRRGALLTAALMLWGLPAWGYIVFLKDGSQIQTKEKYRIEGDKAILVLPSGTEASYDAAEIDVAKTEEINVIDYGTAKLLDGLNPPKAIPKTGIGKEEPSFGEYISKRSLALPEVTKRGTATQTRADEIPLSKAGFNDLMALRRKPYPNADVTAEVLGYLRGQGIDRVRIYQGTAADRPLIEIVAPSEASVFKAIKDASNGLVQIHERFPDQVAAFELVLMTEAQARAGQFLLTPERATELVTGEITAPRFFLQYVEF